jgi:hypothetical protein
MRHFPRRGRRRATDGGVTSIYRSSLSIYHLYVSIISIYPPSRSSYHLWYILNLYLSIIYPSMICHNLYLPVIYKPYTRNRRRFPRRGRRRATDGGVTSIYPSSLSIYHLWYTLHRYLSKIYPSIIYHNLYVSINHTPETGDVP